MKNTRNIIAFFKRFNKRADYEFNIDGLTLDEIPEKLIYLLLKENEEFKSNMKNRSGNYSN